MELDPIGIRSNASKSWRPSTPRPSWRGQLPALKKQAALRIAVLASQTYLKGWPVLQW
eukprot:CAMPEP_0206619014 /NCGR_PEP_ID=MMETSP0325_2-20121206/60595_1 /ASSEMBLY_ACC=CAM_ASM_000347 /TAXON_ID=2866 /ORGANISM="Crypthecodinium cohnii, Strain Seligo" /LENGTH=57 /DNA_ID=CAMNT_0054141341 /DNA_START=162 /DNA_END=332 /DNA_ORIENTATION=+